MEKTKPSDSRGYTFPNPFGGIEYKFRVNTKEQLTAVVNHLVNEAFVPIDNKVHYHNFAIELDDDLGPCIWISAKAAICLQDAGLI